MKALKKAMLSRKVMMSLLAAGVMSAGMAGSAFAETNVEDASTNIVDKEIQLGYIFTSDAKNHNVVIGDENTESVQISGYNVGVYVWGDYKYDTATNIVIKGKKVDIITNGKELGAVEADYGAGKIDITGGEVNIKNKHENGYGIFVSNATLRKTDGVISTVNVEGDSVNVIANESALVAMSDGKIGIEGKDIVIKGKQAIIARGDADVIINSKRTGTVKMDGDIEYNYDGPTSGTKVNALVDMTLTGRESYWKGNSKVTWNQLAVSKGKDTYLKVDALNITLNDGAKWIVTKPVEAKEEEVDSKYTGQDYVGISKLTMNDGIVESKAEGQAITIYSLEGSHATFDLEDGGRINVGNLVNKKVDLISGTMELTAEEAKITGEVSLSKGTDIEVAKNLTLASGSKLSIDDLANYKEYAPIEAKHGKVTAEKGAKVAIGSAAEGTYTIVSAKEVENKMSDEDVTFDGGLKTGTWSTTDNEMKLTVAVKNLEEETELVPVENAGLVETALKNVDFLNKNEVTKGAGDFYQKIGKLAEQTDGGGSVTKAQVKAAIASSVQSGMNNGAASTAVSVVNNVSSLTNNHMSFAGLTAKGGKGVGLFAEDSGASVWAQYLHGKDKADAMPSGSSHSKYQNSYNGILVGADFKKVNKYQSGVAFSYTDGDGSNSSTTAGVLGSVGHTDFKSYGLTYYGAIKNDSVNTMFDLGYSHSKADSDTNILLTGNADSSTSKTNTWSAGVTVEKAFTDGSNGAQFIPYAGVRYMNIKTDDFTTKMGYRNSMEDQNVFLIPVGIRFRQENTYKNGWKVTPKADLSYVWAVGDTDSEVDVTLAGLPSAASKVGYTVMDNGSFLGTIGLEASKANWTYGVSYSYQKGDYQRSDKYFVDVKYSF